MTLLTTSKNFPTLFDRYFNGENLNWNDLNFSSDRGTLPAVNISENEDGYQIEVAAPGLKKDNFKLNLDKGRLTISSQHKEEKEDQYHYSRKEFNYKNFERTFVVPEKVVDSEKITANYEDGILRIGLPKREEVKPKPVKEIQVL